MSEHRYRYGIRPADRSCPLFGSAEYSLRGFVRRRPTGRFVAVCLRPNLVVEADSASMAFDKLRILLAVYYDDAASDCELDRFMRQRAPVVFYIEWLAGQLLPFYRGNWRMSFAR